MSESGSPSRHAATLIEALRHSEDNFRILIERAPFPMCVARANQLAYVNRVMLDYLGLGSHEAAIGPTLAELSEIIHPEDRDRTRAGFAGLFKSLELSSATEDVVRISDVRLRRRCDGSLRFCDLHGVVVVHDGSPAIVTYLHDLTERKAAAERMRLADRMVSLGTLAAGVAHEINNPLTYVMANVELLGRRLATAEPTESNARLLTDARMGLDRIRKVVRSLKTFSRQDEEAVGPVDLVRTLESCIEMAQSHIRHRGQIVRRYTDVPLVHGNEARLGQVFLNLLVNAAQALDEATRELNEVVITTAAMGDTVAVDVRDNGSGIAPDDLPRIFDPFFSTKAVGEGTGLGLFVCHGIVTALGGRICVDSDIGRGTTVRVELPVASSPGGIDPKARRLDAEPRGRILVIDDEPLVLDAVRRTLQEEHDVTALANGHEALMHLLAGECYELILCDLMMPGVTGADLLARLSVERPDMAARLAFMTGGPVTRAARVALAQAPSGRIEKPFEPAELLGFVRERLSGAATRTPS